MGDNMQERVMTAYSGLKASLQALPVHSEEEVAAAVRHLKMMNYQSPVDCKRKDFLLFTKEDVSAELDRLLTLSGEELRKNPSMVEEWTEKDDPAGTERNRIRRMEFLFREYQQLCRLRANEPEAWDRINELYYDD